MEEILKLVNQMEREVEAYKEELYRCCWFMRGGVNMEQLMLSDVKDVDIIQKIIKQNLETAKETGLAFF